MTSRGYYYLFRYAPVNGNYSYRLGRGGNVHGAYKEAFLDPGASPYNGEVQYYDLDTASSKEASYGMRFAKISTEGWYTYS